MLARSLGPTLVALSVLSLGVSLPRAAHAQQVTDADRNAARDLYNDGYTLQQQGHYQEAIDRYGRSLSVFPAPTTAFRIAQCKAAIGQLVEAAEELRAVVNATLPANPPEAFVKAKQEAAVELQQLEPRIPKVKINVIPSPLAGLSVMVDSVPMSVALVGVARPINPGSHRIVAQAPGYSAAQATVDVREKQQPIPEVTLTLQQGGGGVQYTTTPPPPPNNTYQAGGAGGTVYPPQGAGGGVYQNGAYGAYPYGTWVPPRPRPEGPRTALWLGIDGALTIPFGTANPTGTQSVSISNEYGGIGGAGGVDVGLRLARILYLGVLLQGSFFGGNANGVTPTGGGFSFAAGAVLGFMSNPEGAGVYGEVGGAFRTIGFNGTTTSTGATVGAGTSTGGDIILGIGAQIKAGTFRLVPKVDLYVGPNDGNSVHGFFTLGLALFWELPLDKPLVVNATAQPAAN